MKRKAEEKQEAIKRVPGKLVETREYEIPLNKVKLTVEKENEILSGGNNPVAYVLAKNVFTTLDLVAFKEAQVELPDDPVNSIIMRTTRILLNTIKGKWIVKGCLDAFLSKWKDDCMWWKQVFIKSQNQWKKEPIPLDEKWGPHDAVLTMSDPDDLGELLVLIGMYCYGFPGGLARELFIAIDEVPLITKFEVTKFCVDFISSAFVQGDRFWAYARDGDNSRFFSVSAAILDRLFFKDVLVWGPHRFYEDSMRKYA